MIFHIRIQYFIKQGILVFLLLLLASNHHFARITYNLETFGDDFNSLVKQPKNWKSSDWLKLAGAASISYGMMHFDAQIRSIALENKDHQNSVIVEFGRIWGEPLTTLALGSLFYIHGSAAENSANKKLGFEIGEAAFYSTLVTMVLKFGFGRERPRQTSDPFSFHPFSFDGDEFLSFSSGHTVLAFSMSTVLAKNTNNDFLKIAYYVPAFLTAFSRVYQNHHWTSDVIMGGFLGYIIADFVTKLHKENRSETNADPRLEQKPINLFNFKIPL